METEPLHPVDPFAGLPFEEAELLAYVEGELPAPRQRELTAFLESRPDLRRVLTGMRQDRLILCETGDAAAPEGILDGAMAVLERDALLGSGDAPDEAPVPIPIAKARSGGRLRAFAMAAGFLLVAGGSTYWISQMVTPAKQGPGPVAVAPSVAPLSGEKIAMNDATVPGALPDQAELAAPGGPREVEQPDEQVLAKADTPAPETGEVDASVSGFGRPTYPVATISPEHAVELAREGRLAIYLTPHAGAARADSRSGLSASARDGGQVVAGHQEVPSAGMLVIEIPATPGAIGELYAALAHDFDGEVTFGELEEAYETAADSADDEDPIAPFFDSDSGGPRVTVPVLIDDDQ